MAVVISKLFVIVLSKTVVEERTIHRDQSAGLDINTGRERREFLQTGKTRCQVATTPADIESNGNDSWGCQPKTN